MIKKLVSLLFVINCTFCIFCQRVISPVAGNFNNRQILVIDNFDGSECYYSFSGTDPLTSGFVYDGPVLIDSTGRVNVKVTVVKGDLREEIEVNYNVVETNPFETASPQFNFITECVNPGLYSYSFDKEFDIPSPLQYRMGDDGKPWLKGCKLSLDPSNRLSRYVPCSITDGKNCWRFVIFISGGDVGTLSKYSVPFEIKDWKNFVFTGDKLIWNMDDGEWSASKIPMELDRSVKHTINWQSVAYEKGNPVQSFVIPAEPELIVKSNGKDAAAFSINGDLRYRMEVSSTGIAGQTGGKNGLFTSATFDTFEGDSISGEVVFEFYCDGVYQGSKTAVYSVDKQPPLPPEFISGNDSFYARKQIDLRLKGEDNCQIFYAVSNPLKISEELASGSMNYNLPQFESVEAGNFRPYSDSIFLNGGSEAAIFYKVRAYAQDNAGNTSSISEYRVVIDEYNYYLEAGAEETGADGSRDKPFTSFAQALNVINSGRFAHFYVKGSFTLPSGISVISSNCSFTATGDSEFILLPEADIVVRSSSLESRGINWRKDRNSSFDSNSRFFTLENSTVSFADCEIAGIFGENGTVFNGQKSVIELRNAGLTVQADSYACGVSCVDSKVLSKGSRISTVAQTAVNFSVNGGLFECRNTSCRVTAHLGRIAELCNTNIRMSDNNYTGEFEKKVRGITAVWSDKDCLILEDKNNTSKGF